MDDLIEALQIFKKYQDKIHKKYPTHCEHDVLSIMGVNIEDVSDNDIKRVDELGFEWSDEDDCFISFRFGSA